MNLKKVMILFLFILLLSLAGYSMPRFRIEVNLKEEVAKAVSSTSDSGKTKVKVTKEVGPKKIKVAEIIVEGNLYVPKEMILKALRIKPGDSVTPDQISKALSRVYQIGYFSDLDLRIREGKGGYVLIIKVTENPVIKKIEFVGNRLLSRGELLELMDTRAGKLLNFKILRDDIKRINEEYNSMGLIGVPNHVQDINFTPQGVLYIKIKEGYLIKKVVVRGNTVVTLKEVMRRINLKPGTYLRKDDLDKSLKAISQLYKEKGYLLVDIRVKPEKDGVLYLELLEGVLEGIEVQGLKKTKPYVVKEQIELPKGEVINLNFLKRSIRRLSFSGLFKNVSVNFKMGSKPGRVILVVKVVEEPKTGQLVLSAALSGNAGANRGGLAGALSVSELNFKGKGQRLFLQWQQGNYVRQLNFSFWDPYSAPGRTIWGFSYFNTKYTYQRVPIPGVYPAQWAYYTDERNGFSLSYGKRNVRRHSKWLLTLSKYAIKTTPDPSAPPSVTRYMISGNVGSLTLSYSVDTRDDEYIPSSGIYDSYTLENANKLLGDFSYTKFQMVLRRYWRSGKRNVIAARLLAGWASDSTPITSMFVMGGADTLRAYKYNSFIGTKAFLLTLEYRFPITKKENNPFYGAVFVDYGRTFLPDEKFSFSDMKFDYGAGVLFAMPAFGLIRVDYAMSKDERRVVVRVGQSF